MEAYVLEALEAQLTARPARAELLAEADRIRALTPTGPKTDSAEILAEARNERYGR